MTPKQARFCQEYLIDHNATRAAIRAGYKPTSARVTAAKLLTKANISEKIKILLDEQAARCQIEADDVLQAVADIAFGSLGDFLEIVDGYVVYHLKGLNDPRKANALKSLRLRETRYKDGSATVTHASIILQDKITALTFLCRHLGLIGRHREEQLAQKRAVEVDARQTLESIRRWLGQHKRQGRDDEES